MNADGGVLEDDRALGRHARAGRGGQEDLGVGLAPGDVLQRRDLGESAVQAALIDREFQVRADAARPDRQRGAGFGQGVEHLADSVHERDPASGEVAVADLLAVG